MKGIDSVTKDLNRTRYRVSRLIELERVPEDSGRKLLWKVIEAGDLAAAIERRALLNDETTDQSQDQVGVLV